VRKIGVLSGKGGTGKSTIAVSLALGLVDKGYKVGLLDCDLTGPNALDMLGNHPIEVVDDCFVPAESKGLTYISLGHIASKNEPVLWEPKIFEDPMTHEKKLTNPLREAARQLLERTTWDVNLDYLICDFPPGSGAEVQEMLPLMDYVVLVTVPSHLSESNVRRCLEMCREKQVPILGLIKNMTYFECECGKKTRIFPEDHSFEEFGIRVLAEIPLKQQVATEKRIHGLPIEEIVNASPVLLKKKRFKSRVLKFFGKTLFGD